MSTAGVTEHPRDLADVTPEADAVVTNGNGNQFVVLPKMERVIGDIETVRIITGRKCGQHW
ncbi:MAG: glycine/sarcosine/betaine reductase component B subunit [Acutalibacteraceae bacterium]